MSEIEQLASVHLGKAGDGSVVKPYETPMQVDRQLLVKLPRSLNREQYEIDDSDLPFVGHDVWNCYEVSFLFENGLPCTGILHFMVPADSSHIVESKSLKLYLNSYNMHVFKGSYPMAISDFRKMVEVDLRDLLGPGVKIKFDPYVQQEAAERPSMFMWELLEANHAPVDIKGDLAKGLDFNTLTGEDPSILKVCSQAYGDEMKVRCGLLRSNCRVTNQPDWGDVFIYIKGPKGVTEESLLRYIVSLRTENHFHEEICEMIYKRLHDLLPRGTNIFVGCLYTRRGGIDINPFRATDYVTLELAAGYTNSGFYKTERQ